MKSGRLDNENARAKEGRKRSIGGETEVDGHALQWELVSEPQSTTDGLKGLCVSVRRAQGAFRELVIEYPYDRLALLPQRPKLTAAIVEGDIREAIAGGWNPDSRGRSFVFMARTKLEVGKRIAGIRKYLMESTTPPNFAGAAPWRKPARPPGLPKLTRRRAMFYNCSMFTNDAPVDPFALEACFERCRRVLDVLEHTGMELVEELKADTSMPVGKKALAFCRLARAVRLTIMLDWRLSAILAGGAPALAAERALACSPVHRLKLKMSLSSEPKRQRPARLPNRDMRERLDREAPDETLRYLKRALTEVVTAVCAGLGLAGEKTLKPRPLSPTSSPTTTARMATARRTRRKRARRSDRPSKRRAARDVAIATRLGP